MMSRYPAANICIYCRALVNSPHAPTERLSDEHVIPMGIGGNLILPRASCKKCADITSGIETRCIQKLFDPGRTHAGVRTRAKLNRKILSVKTGRDGALKKVLTLDHPGTITMFKFNVATEITNIANNSKFEGNPMLIPVVPDFKERVRRVGGLNHIIGGGISFVLFGRFLAKIAHAYASAEIGLDSFVPYLPMIIIGDPPYDNLLGQYVGSGLIDEIKDQGDHEIRITSRTSPLGKKLIVVRLRLFSQFSPPTYYIGAGILR